MDFKIEVIDMGKVGVSFKLSAQGEDKPTNADLLKLANVLRSAKNSKKTDFTVN